MATRTAARRNQRGAGALEVAVVMPLVLLLILTVVQMTMWQHAQHVVEAAAQKGLESARVEGGTAGGGTAAAQAAVTRLGDQVVVDPQVSVRAVAGGVQVDVDGTAISVVPFIRLPVHAVAQGPVEHVIPPP